MDGNCGHVTHFKSCSHHC